MKITYIFPLLLALSSTATLAQAQPQSSAPAAVQSSSAPAAALQPTTENGITYVCGGVGEMSKDQMKQAAADYDLMLTFAAGDGTYLADVGVEIADGKGRPLLKTTCGGPIMLVDFPKAGAYRVRGDTQGHTVTKSVRVAKGGKVQKTVMAWPK